MPITAENRQRYPANWREIRKRVQERAGDKCESCGVPNHWYVQRSDGRWFCVGYSPRTSQLPAAGQMRDAIEGRKVTLIVCTTAHINAPIENCNDSNLRFLCQKCHLAFDHAMHIEHSRITRRARKAIGDLFPGVRS